MIIPTMTFEIIFLDHLHVQIYFSTVMSIKEQYFSYSLRNCLSEMGGYLGMLLGLSVLDLAGLIRKVTAWVGKFGKAD